MSKTALEPCELGLLADSHELFDGIAGANNLCSQVGGVSDADGQGAQHEDCRGGENDAVHEVEYSLAELDGRSGGFEDVKDAL